MKRRIGIVLILALAFALSAFAETAWECAVCHRRVQAVLGNECPYCGAKRHVHSWLEATCTEPKTCEVCGETEGEALGHAWLEATCTEPKTCSACGATEGTAPGHRWDEGTVVQKATCQVFGVKSFACTVCGITRNEVIAKDPAVHTGGTETKGRLEATCTEDGYTGDTYCTGCGQLISKGSTIRSPGHQWNDGKVIQEATCRAFGVKSVVCMICGTMRDEVIPKNPENHTGEKEVRNRLDATCTADGYTGDTYCTDCGEPVSKGDAIPAPGHQWVEDAMMFEATCRMVGTRSYRCAVCGATRDEILPKDASNHAGGIEVRGTAEATCTEEGYTGDTYCTGCGELLREGDAFPALGHDWQEATYTAPKTCKRCGLTEGEPLERHDAVGSIVTYGHYPQTASGTDSTPIEWMVLEVQGNKALLFSKYGLETRAYNSKRTYTTWETSDMREWLNDTFLNRAFSA